MAVALPPESWLLLIRSHVDLSFGGVVYQHARLTHYAKTLDDSPGPMIDGLLFALALGDFVIAVRVAAAELDSSAIRNGLDAFDRAVPRARDFRNVLEHWNAYGKGQGRLQKAGEPESFTFLTVVSVESGLTHLLVEGLNLDVNASVMAARELYHLTRTELNRALGRHDEPPESPETLPV